MPSRRSLARAGLLALAAAAPARAQNASSKRGLVDVNPNNHGMAQIFEGGDLTWYYNYGASPSPAYAGSDLLFVPMLWGASQATINDTSFYETVKGLIQGGANVTYVLGFNEPDGCTSGGSCVDVITAAAVWINNFEPLRKEFGVKLGAPAVTGAPTGFNWLQNFFTQCAGECHADFIPVHWYGNFEGLASHVGQVNATYENMTTWVTEFALPDADLYDSQQFYNQSSSWLDQLSYVTHYSYFGAFRSSASNVGPNAAFLDSKGQLTDIGAWYLGEKATGNIPTSRAARLAAGVMGPVGALLAAAWLLL